MKRILAGAMLFTFSLMVLKVLFLPPSPNLNCGEMFHIHDFQFEHSKKSDSTSCSFDKLSGAYFAPEVPRFFYYFSIQSVDYLTFQLRKYDGPDLPPLRKPPKANLNFDLKKFSYD